MTTKQIDYCIELARTLNFSRAADNMFVSQPTFSSRSGFWRMRSVLQSLREAEKVLPSPRPARSLFLS